jgi:hypothetical protein
MDTNQKLSHFIGSILTLIVVISLMLSACVGSEPATETPTPPPEPTATPKPTDTPEPTATPIPRTAIFTLNPDTPDPQVGAEIAIVLSFDPPVGIVDVAWEFIVGDGVIIPPKGSDAVVFKAPEQHGAVIIEVSGITEDEVSFEENLTFNVIPQPSPTPLPPCEFTTSKISPPPFPFSSLSGSITTPERCTSGVAVARPVSMGGTADDIPEGVYLWLLVYPPNGRYYPQCNDAGGGLCGANYNQGVWGVTVFLGNPTYSNCKERFYLALVAVDSPGNDFLLGEMTRQGQTGNFTGFAPGELPTGIELIDSLEIETAGSLTACP